jgi:hypothetical protein
MCLLQFKCESRWTPRYFTWSAVGITSSSDIECAQ